MSFTKEILIVNKKLFLCGKVLNDAIKDSFEVYQQYSSSTAPDEYNVLIKSFVEDSYFEFISFTKLGLKLVVGLPLMDGDISFKQEESS